MHHIKKPMNDTKPSTQFVDHRLLPSIKTKEAMALYLHLPLRNRQNHNIVSKSGKSQKDPQQPNKKRYLAGGMGVVKKAIENGTLYAIKIFKRTDQY